MKIFVNAELHEFPGELNIPLLLEKLQVHSVAGMAVAVNENVIPKSRWETFMLNENDKVLIIRATQGG